MAKTPEARAKAAAGGPPDLRRYRGHMRGLFDGRWKFARYFSPREHHRPDSWDDLLRHNDLELYDTAADPGETTNLAADPSEAPRDQIEPLNQALNALIDREMYNIDWLAPWFTGRWAALLWAMAFTALGATVATLIHGKYTAADAPPQQRGSHQPTPWLQSSSQSLPALPEHPFDRPPSRWFSPETLAVVLIASTTFILLTFFW